MAPRGVYVHLGFVFVLVAERSPAEGSVGQIFVDAAMLDMMIATCWLNEADAGDRQRVGAAIAAMLKDAKAQ